ncbi:peptidyl-tRNA hydrolase 2, mitochondrial [Cinnamomum micranthum f. kanehirae]|uniref:peptidyl-tRNA hydrolase n=1 Tax=Cinnamomum micranthum f. kanehirae TaxID=337451 RepID=A0A3S3PRK7_9MAGN|nr:peptidyl-tRNA hydrolase 2, mitochondrial [Cinnamomum micranthum f. kanehirae]
MMDVSWLNALLLGAGCLALGYLIATRRLTRRSLSPPPPPSALDDSSDGQGQMMMMMKKKKQQQEPLEIEKLAEILEDFKMVLVVRNDLKMGKGKIAAQCSHATLGLYKKLLHRAPKALNRWEMCGQVKVVLKIESEEDMLVLQERAKSLKLPTHITIDAGRTQIAPNSRTVMAILGPADLVDEVTGGLKLL